MSKIAVLLAFVCLFAAVQAQTRQPTGQDMCQAFNTICLARIPQHGNTSEVTDIFNARCRRRRPNWRDVTLCELTWASCKLTIDRCATLSCGNIRRALEAQPSYRRISPMR